MVEAIGLTDCVVIGSFRTGGLVGASAGTVNECYATGSVNADDNDTGGLMGVNAYGTLTNCYATVSVNGLSRVGGLVGLNGGIMRNCYATGSVTGDTDVGGLVGDSLGGVSNSFWDTQTSGAASSDGGTGKTTAELMRLETFTDTDTDGLDEAWDMAAVGHGEIDPAAVWNIVDGRGYPFLNWERVRVEVQLELKTGWNMVSVPRGLPEGEDTVEKVFKGEIDAIYIWNPSPTGGESTRVGDDAVLDWQRGYWVAVTEDKIVTLRSENSAGPTESGRDEAS